MCFRTSTKLVQQRKGKIPSDEEISYLSASLYHPSTRAPILPPAISATTFAARCIGCDQTNFQSCCDADAGVKTDIRNVQHSGVGLTMQHCKCLLIFERKYQRENLCRFFVILQLGRYLMKRRTTSRNAELGALIWRTT